MDIELQNLSCGYGGDPLLSGINLQVQPGEIVAIVGPNGVGKSTLIKAASGSLAPLAGQRVDRERRPCWNACAKAGEACLGGVTGSQYSRSLSGDRRRFDGHGHPT